MKLSQNNQDLLFKVGLAVAGYLVVIKPILNFVGITKSNVDRLVEWNGGNPASPFNMNFWQTYYYYKDQGVQKNKKLVTMSIVERINKSIKNLIDGFGYMTDNEDQVYGAIKAMKTQGEISLLAYYFYIKHRRDLLQYLQKGRDVLPQNGLSDSELGSLLEYVKNLPKS